MCPAFDLLQFELVSTDGDLEAFDVIVGDHVEDHGLEFGLGHGFALLGILVDGDSVPDDLSRLQERVVLVAVVLLDEGQEIVDDGGGSHGTLVVAVVVQEAVQDDVLEGFALHALVLTQGDGRGREVPGIPGEKA